MAKVDNVIFCMKATNNENGVSADGILSAITPEYIPGLFTFSVIVIVLDVDLGVDHSFKTMFSDPQGEEVVQLNSSIPATMKPEVVLLPQEYTGINLAMDWNNINLKCSGLYKIRVWFDEEYYEKTIFIKGKNEG